MGLGRRDIVLKLVLLIGLLGRDYRVFRWFGNGYFRCCWVFSGVVEGGRSKILG